MLWNVSFAEEKTLIGMGQDITARKMVEAQLVAKNKKLELKNSEIVQSIHYAKRIQDALIQDPGGLNNYFSGAFILHKPLHVVSGDFYSYYKMKTKVFVAAGDCTRHGVPGAMMSVICTGLIRDAILSTGLEDPAEILHWMDTALDNVLGKEGGVSVTADVMDIALAVFDMFRANSFLRRGFQTYGYCQEGRDH
jgi:serine phosphatase RsbU (regulator of sigma subunit)